MLKGVKHIEIFKKELDNNEIIIVLEDDAIFIDNFKEKLDIYIKELEKINDCHLIFTADYLDI